MVSVGDLLDALGRYRGWEARSLTELLLDFQRPKAAGSKKIPRFRKTFPTFSRKLLDFL